MTASPTPAFATPARLRALGSLLLAAMAAATFAVSSVSVVASSIIEDLAISRQQLGFVATVNVVLGAVLSPRAGKVVDRIGGRRAFIGIFLFGGVAFAVMGAAVAYWILIAGAVIASVSQASGNPATNKLIALHLPVGSRGLVTGIKQSGVQFASFVGGLLLPLGAETIGWRPTLFLAGALTLGLIVPVVRVVPEDRPRTPIAPEGAGPLPPSTAWLAFYGALIGFGGGVFFFVPLFAEEAVGYGPRAAGLAAALMGLVAVASRIAWARFAEGAGRFLPAMGVIAVASVVAVVAFLAATTASPFLWIGAILLGLSANAWTSVGMLAVMHDAGAEHAGRASGYVMLGFLLGFGTAPPVYGRTVDATGSYTTMWWLALAVFAAAAVQVVLWRRSLARSSGTGVSHPDGWRRDA